MFRSLRNRLSTLGRSFADWGRQPAFEIARSERGVIDLLLVALIIIVIGVTAVGLYLRAKNSAPVFNPSSVTKVDPYAGWKTYSSTLESASFKYPADWKVLPGERSSDPNADNLTLQSPSGFKVYWVDGISGLGGACDDKAPLGSTDGNLRPCPQITVVEKADLTHAPSLSAISGTITSDGKTYVPWLEVMDSGTTTSRGMGYLLFNGKRGGIQLGTSSLTVAGTYQNQTQANAWFDQADVKTAKLILRSLTY